MKIKYLQLKNWLLLSIMGVFGLSACHSQKDLATQSQNSKKEPSELPSDGGRDLNAPMYGVPVTNYGETVEVLPDSTVAEVDSVGPGKTVDRPKPREPQVTVYGVPTVDFSIKGKVVDANGKPIKGLQVIFVDSRIDPDNLPQNDYWDNELRRMSDTTDAKGNFEVASSDRPWEKMRVLVRDIDGAKNGSFESQLVDVEFGDSEDKPVSKWKLGTKKAEITVKMKRKKK